MMHTDMQTYSYPQHLPLPQFATQSFPFALCVLFQSITLLDKTACTQRLFFAASCAKSRLPPFKSSPMFLKAGSTNSMDASFLRPSMDEGTHVLHL